MLDIDLHERFRGGLHRQTVLIRDDRRRADDVLEHRGPPGQLQFAVHGVHIHPAGVQIADELAESDRLEIAFQAAAFRQRVQRQTVVIQRLEDGSRPG